VIALVRWELADFLRSHRFLPPLVAYLVVIGVLYSFRPVPVLSSYAITALALYPIAAWTSLLLLGAEDEVQRQVTCVHAGGLLRVYLAKLAGAVLAVVALTALAMAIPSLLNEFTRQPTASQVLVGLLAHLATALPGVLIGALFSNPIVRRQGYALGGVLLCLLLTIPADDLRGVHQGIVGSIGHLAPPMLAVVRALSSTDSAGSAAVLLRADALGAAAFTVLAGAAYLRLARSRS
jgi:hypothetical protein